MRSAPPSLSLVIPVYNESMRLESTLQNTWHYFLNQSYPWQVIVVDDGSTDDSVEIATRFAAGHPGVKVETIEHSGKAAAVLHGMRQATGDHVVFSDADLATPLFYLETFRQRAIAGTAIVIGSREGAGATRVDEPLHRHVMGRVFNGLVRVLLLPGVQDTQCGFKLFTREAVNRLLPNLTLYRNVTPGLRGPRVTAFDVELLVAARRLGLQIEAVPVVWSYGEQSKVSAVGDTVNNLRDVLRVKWRDLRGAYR